MNGPVHRLKALGATALLAAALTACGAFDGGENVSAQPPEIGVSGNFSRGDDGTYLGTVNQRSVTIGGAHNGFVERLRYKLNETEWIDATLTEDSFSFSVDGLQDGSNTLALRIDGVDGTVAVEVVVVEYTEDGSAAKIVPDPLGVELVALTDGNTLTFFNSSSPEATDTLLLSGVEGTILGFDVRPATGELYALSSTNTLYTVDTGSGVATPASTLSEAFTSRARSGVDFNPVADRLRVTGANGQNFRVNVDTGEVILDGELAFNEGDTNEGLAQNVTASAYTNSVADAETTELYNLDASLNALLLQDPPNDGGLATVGALGVNLGAVAGFDIVSRDDGSTAAYAVSAGQLYTVDLEAGTATLRGAVGDGEGRFQGLAALLPGSADGGGEAPMTDPNPKGMVALGADNTLVRFNSANPENGNVHEIRGVRGTLLGVDIRPADGKLYGLSDRNRLYTIDLSNGHATQVSRLSERFGAGELSGVDFNPAADRLRVTGANGQNFRVNVDTGEVTLDGELSYVEGDANVSAKPAVTASAYTNSVADAETTELYNLDAGTGSLVLQDPPNDGGLQTVAELEFDLAEVAGFDISTDDAGADTAYAVSGNLLYIVDLGTGRSSPIGTLAEGSYRGLAVVSGN